MKYSLGKKTTNHKATTTQPQSKEAIQIISAADPSEVFHASVATTTTSSRSDRGFCSATRIGVHEAHDVLAE